MAGATQTELYAGLDLELSWSETELPQAERTKHVHGLHPYLGKFVPQLAEVFLRRWFAAGDTVFDPFCGSGTTLVEAAAFGAHAVGVDISAFNCLLSGVKCARHPLARLDTEISGALARARETPAPRQEVSPWLARWYAPRALDELLAFRAAADALEPQAAQVARVILSRAARSSRLAAHFDLDFPRAPVAGPYLCHKHRRTCRPVEEASKFLRRYTLDTIGRIGAFAQLRAEVEVEVVHADARTVELARVPTGIITSPPYPGLIDYHEQHRYAYELLGLRDRSDEEIGRAARGRSRAALAAYVESVAAVLGNAAAQMESGSPVVIVVNDSCDLYPEILRRSGLTLEERLTRHVNRRTGRRAGEYYEDVLLCSSG